ncbi:MAG TPA: CoA pyrophosphatase [Candidatus Acidoferrales bacterium]|nr:CoA pyrophosphatase [Candidatus Acidoferrales bacterium]
MRADRAWAFLPGARPAAVVAILLRRGHQWLIPFVVRRPDMRSHPGQVGLPGGAIEIGETPWAAAAREAEEEIGVPARDLTPLGACGRVHLSVYNFAVLPFIAHLHDPSIRFQANPDELTAILEVPLRDLLNPERWSRDESGRLGHHFPVAGTAIWGLTARLLEDLLPPLARALDNS